MKKQEHFDIKFFLSRSSSVTDHLLHAAVGRVRDAQPGGLHPLLPERSAGQLPGRLSAGETNPDLNPPHRPTLQRGRKDVHLNESFNLTVNF